MFVRARWASPSPQLAEQGSHEEMPGLSSVTWVTPHCPCEGLSPALVPPGPGPRLSAGHGRPSQPARQPLRLGTLFGQQKVARSGTSRTQSAVAAHRRSCSLRWGLICCLAQCWRCYGFVLLNGIHNQKEGV